MISCVSSSDMDPREIYKNCLNSFLEFLPAPSAMLLGIETAHLRIWFVSPYFSASGNFEVILYIFLTNWIDFFHTSKSKWVLNYYSLRVTSNTLLVTHYSQFTTNSLPVMRYSSLIRVVLRGLILWPMRTVMKEWYWRIRLGQMVLKGVFHLQWW